jgi:hypothetical protein
MNRARFVAAALLALTCAGTAVPSQAQTVFAARTTTVTGSFRVNGNTVLTVKAETRLRAVGSWSASNPLAPSLNPAETVTTILVCNQAGCNLPSNRLCLANPAQIDEEATGQGAIRIVSSDPNCRVDITATLANPKAPQVFADRIESVSAATFNSDAIVMGSTGTGTDGRVVRSTSWYAA